MEATLRGLDARQKIGPAADALLFILAQGLRHRAVKAQFESYEVGGAITFGRDWKTIREATAEVGFRLKVRGRCSPCD